MALELKRGCEACDQTDVAMTMLNLAGMRRGVDGAGDAEAASALYEESLEISEANGRLEEAKVALVNIHNMHEFELKHMEFDDVGPNFAPTADGSPNEVVELQMASYTKAATARRRIRQIATQLGRSDADAEDCPICLEKLKGDAAPVLSADGKPPPHATRMVVLPCLHIMHMECFAKSARDKCPCCNLPV